MDNQEEWGPWIEHDGKGCPCVGQYCHMLYYGLGLNLDGSISDYAFGIAGEDGGESWDWKSPCNHIIRYRIRKPLGLIMLEAIARDITTPIVKVNA